MHMNTNIYIYIFGTVSCPIGSPCVSVTVSLSLLGWRPVFGLLSTRLCLRDVLCHEFSCLSLYPLRVSISLSASNIHMQLESAAAAAAAASRTTT